MQTHAGHDWFYIHGTDPAPMRMVPAPGVQIGWWDMMVGWQPTTVGWPMTVHCGTNTDCIGVPTIGAGPCGSKLAK